MPLTTNRLGTLLNAVHKACALLARSRKACTPCTRKIALAFQAENTLIEGLEAVGQLPGQARRVTLAGTPDRAGIEREDTQLSRHLCSVWDFWDDRY